MLVLLSLFNVVHNVNAFNDGSDGPRQDHTRENHEEQMWENGEHEVAYVLNQ